MNPLIIYLKPKDGVPEVEKELKKINCDKLTLKYFPYPDVYKIAHRTIIEHPEYTHIIWLQNDIVLTKDAYFSLCQGIKETRGAILGASMNVDLTPKGLETCAFTVEQFYFDEKDGFTSNQIPYEPKGKHNGIIKVFHNGGVFIAERELLVHHPLTGFGKSGYNADIVHGLELRKNGIRYYLDTRIHLHHYRFLGSMQVGKKPPEINFEKS